MENPTILDGIYQKKNGDFHEQTVSFREGIFRFVEAQILQSNEAMMKEPARLPIYSLDLDQR